MKMKRQRLFFMFVLLFLTACEILGDGTSSENEGRLELSFSDGYGSTRAGLEIPDTNDFILTVSGSDGKTIYEGAYADAPDALTVKAGSYDVKAVSCRFDRPQFSSPQFGDEQCVVVPSEGVVSVKLMCSQMNSGIRLQIAPSFLSAYPDASLLLRSDDGGLPYSYRETRIAYFNPGNVSLVMSQGGDDKVLMTRWMEQNEILTLKVDVSKDHAGLEASEGISVCVDTARFWSEGSYVLGEDGVRGESSEDPMGISQAKASVGCKGVWVSGYIVAGDLTSASASFEEPFKSASNLAIGPKRNVADRSSCLAVQLPSGDVRDNLNLVSHPEYLGRRLVLKGDIVASYYGLVGIKNVTDYVLE